jgi:hypothetical protein
LRDRGARGLSIPSPPLTTIASGSPAFVRNGDEEHALADESKALEINPRSADGHRIRGVIYRARGDQGRATSPMGRGRRAAPGEGIRSIDTPKPLTRIASDDAIRPLPAGEVTNRPFHPSGSAKAGTKLAASPHATSCSQREAPEPLIYLSPQTRAWGMPDARCTRSLVCNCSDRTHTSNNEHTGITRHSRTQWFYGLLRALPGDRALLPPSPANQRCIHAR